MSEKEPSQNTASSAEQQFQQWLQRAKAEAQYYKIQLEKSLKMHEVLLQRVIDMRKECEGLLRIVAANPILEEDTAELGTSMRKKIEEFKKEEVEIRAEIQDTQKLIQESDQHIADLEKE